MTPLLQKAFPQEEEQQTSSALKARLPGQEVKKHHQNSSLEVLPGMKKKVEPPLPAIINESRFRSCFGEKAPLPPPCTEEPEQRNLQRIKSNSALNPKP